MAYHLFSTGEVLTAANVNSYLMNQTVMVFASASARTTALSGVLAEGMISYRTDAHVLEVYNGTAWVASETNLTTKGDLATFDTAPQRLAVGSDGTTLVANSSASTGLSWNPLSAAGKNIIKNGDFSGWTRGTSFTNPASGTYQADRFTLSYYDAQPTTYSITQQTFTPGTAPVAGYEGIYFARSTITTVGSTTIFRPFDQKIEDVRTLSGQTITISLWAKGDSARTLTLNFQQNFGSGGSAASGGSGQTFTLSTSWQRFTWTFALPSVTGKTIGAGSNLEIIIQQAAASGSVLDIWGVQVEAGSVVTQFQTSGGNPNLEAASSGSAGFDGVLVSTNSATNPSGSGTNGWAGYGVAGKNAVINGGMDIWQRGTSIALAASTTAANGYNADRWDTATGANQAVTISRQATADTTNLPNIQYCLRYQRNSGQTGTSTISFATTLETANSIPFVGKTVNLSFYMRVGSNFSPTSNLVNAYIIYGTGTDQNVLTTYTGSTTLTPFPVGVNPTTTWARFNGSVSIPSGATQLAVLFQFTPTGTAGANDYFEITGVQLELGSVATTFSRAGGTIQGELAACQRYYWRAGGDSLYQSFGSGSTNSAGTAAAYNIVNPVSMRVSPTSVDFSTLANSDGSTFQSISALVITYGGKNSSYLTGTASGMTTFRPSLLVTNNSTSGYFGLNAEL